MLYLTLILYILVTATPWFRGTSPKILHPVNVFVIMQLALVVPGTLVAITDPEAMDPRIINAVGDFEGAMAWTLLLFTLLNACIYAAFYFWRARQPAPTHDHAPLIEQTFDSYAYVGVLIGFMVISFLLKAWVSGGFDYVLTNLSGRAELQRGAGPFAVVEQVSRLLVCFVAVRVALLRKTGLAWLVLAGVVVTSFIIGGVFGSRKSALEGLMVVGITASFYTPRFFVASPRNVIAVAAAYVVIVFLLFLGLLYRNSDAQIEFDYVLQTSWDDIKLVLISTSYMDTYYFITNFYDSANYYYWTLLGDLKTVMLPSSLFPEKAITDDGVYIKYAIQGLTLPAQTPVSLIVADSMPPETLGSAYINGGPFAVPFYGLVLGSVFAFFLRRAEQFPNSPMWMLLMFWVFTTFELSNLRLTQLAMLIISLLIVRTVLKPLEVAAMPRLQHAT